MIRVSQLPTPSLNLFKTKLTVARLDSCRKRLLFIDMQHDSSSLIEARLTGTQVSIKVTAKDFMQPGMGDRRSSNRGISGESVPLKIPLVIWFAMVVSI